MPIQDRLRDDLKSSLKSGLAERVGVLRLLLSELHNKEKERFARLDSAARQAKAQNSSLEESEVLIVLQREAKKRKEAIELFRKGNREDLACKEEAEIAVIGEYLPAPMSKEEVVARVDALIAGGLRDFNSLMKEAMKELKGKVDGQVLASVIKERLGK